MQHIGRYEILAELGRGGMGAVYRARDPRIDRVVAVKTITVLGANPAEEQQYRERFFREAQAAGKLAHPGIVTIYDVDDDPATHTPFIVMEYVAGRTLDSIVADAPRGVPPLQATLDIVRQIAEALDYAHAHSIVHRDIKPANVLVTETGRAKIADFGVAKLTQQEFTVPGQIVGTAAYMAPEQLQGKTVDGRADLFALGVILYWMVTGEKPFSGGDTTAILYKVAFEDPPPVTARNPSVMPELNGVVRRALAKDPAQRYQRGQEFAGDLQDLIEGRVPRTQVAAAASATPPIETTVIETRQPRRTGALLRFLWRVVTAGIAAAIALGVFFGLPSLMREEEEPLPATPAIVAPAPAVSSIPEPPVVEVPARPPAILDPRLVSIPPAPAATLHIRCSHAFRSARLYVWAGDKLISDGRLVGAVRKRWFKSDIVFGTFAESVKVPTGKASLRVRVYSPNAGYDETQEIAATFSPKRASTLVIGFGVKTRRLRLTLQK